MIWNYNKFFIYFGAVVLSYIYLKFLKALPRLIDGQNENQKT